MNLAERTIRDAQPGPKQRFLWDAQVKGLGVRITPAGSKAYVLDYRIHGWRRRGVLARVSEISLREARCRAGAAVRDAQEAIGATIAAQLDGAQAAPVVPLRAAR